MAKLSRNSTPVLLTARLSRFAAKLLALPAALTALELGEEHGINGYEEAWEHGSDG